MRILCTGDLHIGRRPSRLAAIRNPQQFSCAVMWESMVSRAIAERVDLVALSGDLVERDNRFFEAIGPLERGLERLAEAGIKTFAVSGNHDFDVLPKLADNIGAEHFHLLGRGGQWEQVDHRQNGRTVLQIQGWSFPAERVVGSPMARYQLTPDTEIPTLALLHADLDTPNSPYAPVARSELQRRPVTLWLLGHLHAPRQYEVGGSPVLYPGSPQAMDPGETGPHGPWLLDIQGARRVRTRQLAMSRVRYDTIQVDLTGIENRDRLHQQVTDSVRDHLNQVSQDSGPLEYLSCRLHLVGRTPLTGNLGTLLKDFQEDLELKSGQVTARVERILADTRPSIDLEALSRSQDPLGILARLLIGLQKEEQDPALEPLIRDARQTMVEVLRHNAFGLVADDPLPDVGETRRTLLEQGRRLLDQLLRQKELA